MKPEKFVKYLVQHQQDIMKGWVSGAAFEGHVQVVIDEIARNHLSKRIAEYTAADDSKFRGQQDGKDAIISSAPDAQIGYVDWARMREIKYDGSKQISDFFIKNERFVQVDDDDDNLEYEFKGTFYWIELKVESPATKGYADFGGKTPKDAMEEDINKLKKQKVADTQALNQGNTYEKRRYWYVMLAFSDNRRAYVKKLSGWTISSEYVHPYGSMLVCLYEA